MPVKLVRAFRCSIAVLAILTAACAAGAPDAVSPPHAVDELRIGTFAPPDGTRRLVGQFSAEPLVAIDWDGRPVYRVAESVTPWVTGMGITVVLRPNVKFHDGSAVTAEAIRDLLLQGHRVKVAIRTVVIENERTLALHLHRPHGLKVEDLSLALSDDAHPAKRTGPFKVISFDPPVLEGYSGYDQGAPIVKRLVIQRFPTHRAALTAMMRGEVNFLHEVSREAIDFLAAGGDIQIYPLLRPYTILMTFNLRHPILKRREVRLALNEAVDRDEIVRNALRGHGQVAEGPFWPYHWAYSRGRYPSPYNPEAAKVRLDAAALPVRTQSSEHPPSRFRLDCLVLDDPRFERIALVLQRQMAAVGIDLELRALKLPYLLARIKSGDYEAVIFENLTGRTLDWPYVMWHSRVSGFSSGYTTADGALDRMLGARTEDDTRLAVAEVMNHLRNDPPAVFLAMGREARAAHNSLLIRYEPDRDVFGTLWQIKPVRQLAGQPGR